MEFWLLSSHSGGPLRLRWIEQPLKRQAWALYVVLKSMLIIIINLIFVVLKGLIIFTIMNGACHPTLLRRVRKPKLGLWFFEARFSFNCVLCLLRLSLYLFPFCFLLCILCFVSLLCLFICWYVFFFFQNIFFLIVFVVYKNLLNEISKRNFQTGFSSKNCNTANYVGHCHLRDSSPWDVECDIIE